MPVTATRDLLCTNCRRRSRHQLSLPRATRRAIRVCPFCRMTFTLRLREPDTLECVSGCSNADTVSTVWNP